MIEHDISRPEERELVLREDDNDYPRDHQTPGEKLKKKFSDYLQRKGTGWSPFETLQTSR